MGDTVQIHGSGFSASSNSVTVDGQSATVGVNGVSMVEITVPGGIATNRHVVVVLTNNTDASTYTWWWFSQATVGSLGAPALAVKIPHVREQELGLQAENTDRVLSKVFERWADKLELIPNDLVNAKGALATMRASGSVKGLRQVAPGATNQFLTSWPDGAVFQDRRPHTLTWGRQLAAGTVTATLMEAGAIDSTTSAFSGIEPVLSTGRVAIVSVRCRSSATSRVNKIELLKNGAVVSTQDLVPGINAGQVFTFYPNLAVVAGDRIEVRITKNNASTAWLGSALAVIV